MQQARVSGGHMSKTVHLSVVTPVYGCALSLKTLYERLVHSLSKITEDFEIIMVNDASPDNAWEIIQKLAEKDSRVKGIKLSRNFGQHYAITAGLDFCSGDWTVVMDCDLQDQPEEIVKLYAKAMEGYDIVFGRRIDRKDNFFKRLSSRIFYKIYDYFTETLTDETVANFSIISKKVLRAYRQYREQNRSYALFVNLLGFKRTDIEIEHAQRVEGKSSYTFSKLLNLAIDGIVSQSNKPLRLSIKLGFILALSALLFSAWLILRYLLYGISVEGWTSVMVSMYLIGGLLFLNLGFLGLYIGKIFDETKKRPLYIIDEMTWKMEGKDIDD
jgi:glycosyltransferase involved in cell wall biosynthesis